MNQFQRLFKTVQRRIYDFLLTKYGLSFLCISMLVILVFILQLSDTILEYRLSQFRSFADVINASLVLKLKYNNVLNKTRASKFPATQYEYDYYDDGPQDDFQDWFKTDIDVVYTWVNGSDPVHLENLKKYKAKHTNSTLQYVKIELDEYIKSLNVENNTNITKVLRPCFHKYCMQNQNLIVVKPQLEQIDKQFFLKNAKKTFNVDFYSNISIDNLKNSDRSDQNLSIIYMNGNEFKENSGALIQLSDILKRINVINRKNPKISGTYKFFMGYYTIDCNLAPNCIEHVNRTFIIKRSNSNSDTNDDDLSKPMELPKYIQENLIYKHDYTHIPPSVFDPSKNENNNAENTKSKTKISNEIAKSSIRLSVFKVNSRDLDNNLSMYLSNNFQQDKVRHEFYFKNSNGKNISYNLYRAKIVWDLGDPFAEDVAENRFYDNDELKYSFRSLEKYAPWIRNVYLVTNGQIPNWLNLTHPKIKLVTHQDIFVNKSHLPTFSSPAIESHLHRIKGLSKRFIYFNDDVILMKNIYPDDFFSLSKGFKFHMGWALPGCNPNCPSNWISDGYCDKACNTPECEFDGGDCNRSKNGTLGSHYDNARLAFLNQSQLVFPGFYCSTGCSTSWLSDKYCDNACNNKNCAYDLADCGLANFKDLYGIEIKDLVENEKIIELPTRTLAFYVNFTNLQINQEDFDIIKANHEDNEFIRKMSVVNKYHLLTVLLMPNAYSEVLTNNTEQQQFRVFIEMKTKNNTEKLYKINILFRMNSILQEDVLKTNSQTKNIQVTTVRNRTSKNQTILNNFFNLKPKILRTTTSNSNFKYSINLTSFIPENVHFSNRLFKNTYESYFNYLNWSLSNDFISEDGFYYKLNQFKTKLNTNINDTYSEMIENLDNNEAKDNLIFRILFDNHSTHDIFSKLEKDTLMEAYFKNSTKTSSETDFLFRFKKRKLLDTFADSLRYVNRLFNQIYGYMARKVPAHMPHFIDRQIMRRLQEKFKNEFEKTSANRLRTSTDMQYGFAYYYYVISELNELDAGKLFDEIDLNMNGYLDESELMIISLKMSTKPFSSNKFVPHEASPNEMYTLNNDLVNSLNECKQNQSDHFNRDKEFNDLGSIEKIRLNRTQFMKCDSLIEFLKKNLNNDFYSKYKYKYEIVGDEETKFVMIGGDPLEIDIKLSNLIRQPRKFVCLNDNIDYKLEIESTELKRIIQKFYSSLFPLKSTFELADSRNQSNDEFSSSSHNNLNRKFLNGENSLAYQQLIDERQNDQDQLEPLFNLNFRDSFRFFFYIALFIIVILFIFYLFKKCFVFIFSLFKSYIFSKSKNEYFKTKSKIKNKKREHKISNALLQKMNNESSDDSDDSDEQYSDMQNINNKKSQTVTGIRKETGIVMRPKKNSNFRKTNKKTNTSHV